MMGLSVLSQHSKSLLIIFLHFLSDFPGEKRLPEDWDHFHVLLKEMLHRVPSLAAAELDQLTNGPEAFSPDCKWILGQASEVGMSNTRIPVFIFI